jgi:hypothetical protein
VKRLELASVHVCQRCGRGRAELVATDGTTIAVPLDAVRAQELGGKEAGGDAPWLSTVVVGLLRGEGFAVREVVLDTAERGLRALMTLTRTDETLVITCTPQEGVGLAVRGSVALYATAEALAASNDTPDPEGHETLH